MRLGLGRTLVALAVGVGLAGCGEVKNTASPTPGSANSLTLMLDYFPNADHVGIYAAQANGYFRQADLDVHIEAPTNAATPLQLLAAGRIDVAIGYEPEVLLARNQGTPLVSVAAIVQRPLTSIVSLGKEHITSPGKLRGKTVGDSGIPYQHAFLNTILGHAGVPTHTVKEVNVGEGLVPAMISGRVDATLGAYWNYEAIELRQLHKRPNVIHMDQAGVPNYDELVFVVRKATIVDHPGLIRRFVQAVARGYEAARTNPSKAVNQLVGANPGLDRKLQLASVRATLSSFFPAGNHPWGWQDPTQWNSFGTWMMRRHLISNPNAIIDSSTNELLAGQGI
ncbi:MAG TPA: ABC transporter substrate-binding protein [Solirubrobacteraceae bacterium]|jgi:putative hydroxymethylpyrimidine transport system substrate-binding protein|nr:ABC transporter substrate-binding protein [Solirubrobacteraceae bacterium]